MLLIHLVDEVVVSPFSPEGTGVEAAVSTVVQWLILLAEVTAASFIAVGLIMTLARMIRVLRQRVEFEGYEKARLTMARFLALALEFQLAADVLSTAVAPSWTQIGKLGAIAVIRTALNYFLGREIKEEENISNKARAGIRVNYLERARQVGHYFGTASANLECFAQYSVMAFVSPGLPGEIHVRCYKRNH